MMLSENLKQIRKAKELSNEELASRLHVVRQTVSKWEKGLSVPDSEMLIRISDQLETPVSVLLGETLDGAQDADMIQAISEKLSRINEELAKNAEKKRKRFRAVSITGLTAVLIYMAVQFIPLLRLRALLPSGANAAVSLTGGAAGPEVVLVSAVRVNEIGIFLALAVLAASVAGMYQTRKR